MYPKKAQKDILHSTLTSKVIYSTFIVWYVTLACNIISYKCTPHSKE